MRLSKNEKKRLRNLITRLEKAARWQEFKGCQHPDIWEAIEEDYKRAKGNLRAFIDKL